MSSSGLKIVILIFCCLDVSFSKKCGESDWEYAYTECNSHGQRWLVSIPKYSNITCDPMSEFRVPKKARDCGNPCDPGTFLDTVSQECRDCSQGTYSQSATIEFDTWQNFPPGFQSFSIGSDNEDCKMEEWKPKEDFLETTVSKCESHLYYSVSLFKDGDLTFEYLNPEPDLIFAVKISNDNCQSSSTDTRDFDSRKFLDSTDLSHWKRLTIKLKSGKNLLKWEVSGIESQTSTVKIRYIKITNSIYSSNCIKCTAGYYSSVKSSKCTPCPMNKYSNVSGSASCSDCPPDKYSFLGSTACIDRPSCVASDYTFKWTECDKNNQRKKIYYWIEPKICSDLKLDSVKLPSDPKFSSCSPCPAGTFLDQKTNRCEFCPAGTASKKPGDACTKCGPNTQALTEVIYDQWSHPLPNITFRCLKIDLDCNSNETWIFDGDSLRSSAAYDINLLQFDFQIDRKKNSTGTSEFSFEFSLDCKGYCVLHFFLKPPKSSTMRINSWVNSTQRRTFNYGFYPEDSGQFIWLFSRSKHYKVSQKSNDFLSIYSIKMTQLKNVGAVFCKNCNPLFPNTNCADCGKGKYFSKTSQNCTECPNGFILKQKTRNTEDDCTKCGQGLIAVNGTDCLPDMHFFSSNKNHYDLSKLNGTHTVLGNNLFTTHGQQYKHLFKTTLFNGAGVLSTCKNNFTVEIQNDYEFSLSDNLYEESGPMCRLTIINGKNRNDSVYAMQSILLADQFTEVFQSNASGRWKEMNESLISKGFPADATGMDLHFRMKSKRTTENCKDGYGTIVTLHCDLTATESQLLLPPKCSVETCDGCNFHLLLKSKYACPECREEDYSIIIEACNNGVQRRHYKAPNYCIKASKYYVPEATKCPMFSMKMEVAMIVVAAVLIFLLCLVVYCHKKNKKLEYKYMRLIGGNDDNDNVLNGAESCAVHDDDEEEDDVKIKTHSKSGKIFAKYNRPLQYKSDKSSMERINLSENPDFDI